MKHILNELIEHRSLSKDTARQVLIDLAQGKYNMSHTSAFMTVYMMRAITVDELQGFRDAMLELCLPARFDQPVMDLCGTGGDGGRSFNVSTAASFVACAAGARVAKHGNRGVSSGCGSADVLQALGLDITLGPGQLAQCLQEVGMAFMFTPNHHPAMRRLAGVRKALGMRTVGNITGPLTNPARVPHQLVGVFDARLAPQLAQVLARLGSRRALVVHGHDGLDEITLSGRTLVAELRDGVVGTYEIAPENFGIARAPPEALRTEGLMGSCRMLQQALSGDAGPARDVVLLNAGAALYACGVAASLQQGVARAAEAVDSGAAQRKLRELVRFSRTFNRTETRNEVSP